ncbi:HEAT repeat-containing protein 6 isoform X2 [Salvelinus fontinalis]|nr:HEAT repeat-containing protein 6 isoform X2 [Salvelinus fontinalis]
MELRRVALSCLNNLCLGVPGQAPLEDPYRSVCFRVFLQTLQSPRPPDAEELLYCTVVQGAVKGLQSSLCGGEWRFGGQEELGTLLAVLKRLMFQGCPGVCVDWPSVLYPAPLPQYETCSTPKPAEPPRNPPTQTSGNKKKKSRGRGRKGGEEDEEREAEPRLQRGGRGGEAWSKTSVLPPPGVPSLYPLWKSSSDSEFSDPEGAAHSKLRLFHGRVRQGVLLCLLAVVKAVEKRTLYGYWSSFIPDAPIGGPPPLTLLTVVLKDPSPKVRACALQVVSALLDGSRQFLGVAEDLAPARTSYTPFSFSLATAVRELHRSLSLALLAEASAHTLTQIIKCLAHLVCNAPYNRLRPGLLSPLWRQIRPYLRHRDVNVRVSVLTLYGALVSTQAPLSEIQLLLTHTSQETVLSWRQRGGFSSPSHKYHTPGEEEPGVPWLLQLCVSLVTQPRDDQSDSEGPGGGGATALEPSPVRLEALQVLAHLVRGYFPLCQACLCDLGQVSARCLRETDPSIQLHGAKLLEELGTGIIQQYRPDSSQSESCRIPISQVVQFWVDVLSGPLNGALQSHQHPTLQTSACDTLSSILPQAFTQLPVHTLYPAPGLHTATCTYPLSCPRPSHSYLYIPSILPQAFTQLPVHTLYPAPGLHTATCTYPLSCPRPSHSYLYIPSPLSCPRPSHSYLYIPSPLSCPRPSHSYLYIPSILPQAFTQLPVHTLYPAPGLHTATCTYPLSCPRPSHSYLYIPSPLSCPRPSHSYLYIPSPLSCPRPSHSYLYIPSPLSCPRPSHSYLYIPSILPQAFTQLPVHTLYPAPGLHTATCTYPLSCPRPSHSYLYIPSILPQAFTQLPVHTLSSILPQAFTQLPVHTLSSILPQAFTQLPVHTLYPAPGLHTATCTYPLSCPRPSHSYLYIPSILPQAFTQLPVHTLSSILPQAFTQLPVHTLSSILPQAFTQLPVHTLSSILPQAFTQLPVHTLYPAPGLHTATCTYPLSCPRPSHSYLYIPSILPQAFTQLPVHTLYPAPGLHTATCTYPLSCPRPSHSYLYIPSILPQAFTQLPVHTLSSILPQAFTQLPVHTLYPAPGLHTATCTYPLSCPRPSHSYLYIPSILPQAFTQLPVHTLYPAPGLHTATCTYPLSCPRPSHSYLYIPSILPQAFTQLPVHTLSSILPQAFTQLPVQSQVLCVTVLLGLTYSDNSLVKAAAVRALGVYILFPCLREDVMFVADTANAILTALDDRSPNVRSKAAWSLGNLTDTLIVNMGCVGEVFQEELSDMLVLQMLQSATKAAFDKDRVRTTTEYSDSIQTVFRQYSDSIQTVFRQYSDKDRMRTTTDYSDSIQTVFRQYSDKDRMRTTTEYSDSIQTVFRQYSDSIQTRTG